MYDTTCGNVLEARWYFKLLHERHVFDDSGARAYASLFSHGHCVPLGKYDVTTGRLHVDLNGGLPRGMRAVRQQGLAAGEVQTVVYTSTYATPITSQCVDAIMCYPSACQFKYIIVRSKFSFSIASPNRACTPLTPQQTSPPSRWFPLLTNHKCQVSRLCRSKQPMRKPTK